MDWQGIEAHLNANGYAVAPAAGTNLAAIVNRQAFGIIIHYAP